MMERIRFMNIQAQRLSFGGDTWTRWQALRFSYWQIWRIAAKNKVEHWKLSHGAQRSYDEMRLSYGKH